MRFSFLFLCVLFFYSLQIHPARREYFILWNIGQGQWLSYVGTDFCLHFDAGGEFAPWSKIQIACKLKKNYFYLSHWDQDHVSFALPAAQKLGSACIAQAPLGMPNSSRKNAILEQMATCKLAPPKRISLLHWQPAIENRLSKKPLASNDLSHVWMANQVLAPGDSTHQQEKLWSSEFTSARVLVAGHHGSHTSTSEKLLASLTKLQQVLISSRFKRYHHPHIDTIQKLRAHHLPFITTEDWGSILFY